jgi:hypothetical protein
MVTGRDALATPLEAGPCASTYGGVDVPRLRRAYVAAKPNGMVQR